ncbi:hypothetical protein KFE25_007374 [Diacronema lutheri]|uniref:Uncharacterized protein n=1 Tax=Diacronema lutheri TaxID=2081491 RepID=A0A8J5XTV9_DIALT|nr:hypothetical protein KFE25_007374 [Diacronema lutheri]
MSDLTSVQKVALVGGGVLVALAIEYILRKGKAADEAPTKSAPATTAAASSGPSAAATIKALVEVEYCGG